MHALGILGVDEGDEFLIDEPGLALFQAISCVCQIARRSIALAKQRGELRTITSGRFKALDKD